MKVNVILVSRTSIDNNNTERDTGVEVFAKRSSLNGCHKMGSISEEVARLFHSSDALVFIGAMGICVRSIAPHTGYKHTDPAVVNVDGTGRFVVSVLSGTCRRCQCIEHSYRPHHRGC